MPLSVPVPDINRGRHSRSSVAVEEYRCDLNECASVPQQTKRVRQDDLALGNKLIDAVGRPHTRWKSRTICPKKNRAEARRASLDWREASQPRSRADTESP